MSSEYNKDGSIITESYIGQARHCRKNTSLPIQHIVGIVCLLPEAKYECLSMNILELLGSALMLFKCLSRASMIPE